ncbi:MULTISPECIES: hypothetical protein [unclassified Bradyrhizobium]|uniref:hypothetical protein n=1 Tax=unclassified Bradyrhizobium TaxID=2631580 RepID=UPI00339153B7
MEQHQRIFDELKTFVRLCLERAQDSTLPPLEQTALLETAPDCRAEAARCRTDGPQPLRTFTDQISIALPVA